MTECPAVPSDNTAILSGLLVPLRRYWAWPSKRRIEVAANEFADSAEVKIRFMPFQLYPQLPAGRSNDGVVKDELFRSLIEERAPGMSDEAKLKRVEGLVSAWKAEGLRLKSPPTGLNAGAGGRMGSSFDAQRLILLARRQGREDAMIEEVYAANHSRDECLSDWCVLSACAKRAGVRHVDEALASGWGAAETAATIEEYRRLGVTAVPMCIVHSIDGQPIRSVLSSGAPEPDFLRAALHHIIEHGRLPWAETFPQPPPPQAAIKKAGTPKAAAPKAAAPKAAAPKATAPKAAAPKTAVPRTSTASPTADVAKEGSRARARVLEMLGAVAEERSSVRGESKGAMERKPAGATCAPATCDGGRGGGCVGECKPTGDLARALGALSVSMANGAPLL